MLPFLIFCHSLYGTPSTFGKAVTSTGEGSVSIVPYSLALNFLPASGDPLVNTSIKSLLEKSQMSTLNASTIKFSPPSPPEGKYTTTPSMLLLPTSRSSKSAMDVKKRLPLAVPLTAAKANETI
ncbi:hypothetical protein D3C85_1297430 [compost metagenome]